jgi:hypothetical protein
MEYGFFSKKCLNIRVLWFGFDPRLIMVYNLSRAQFRDLRRQVLCESRLLGVTLQWTIQQARVRCERGDEAATWIRQAERLGGWAASDSGSSASSGATTWRRRVRIGVRRIVWGGRQRRIIGGKLEFEEGI